MGREDILERLREHEPMVRARGVAHVALFGSRARGEENSESDTDILIEFDPSARVTVFDYAGVKHEISCLFSGSVDVIDRSGLKPRLAQSVESDAVYAF